MIHDSFLLAQLIWLMWPLNLRFHDFHDPLLIRSSFWSSLILSLYCFTSSQEIHSQRTVCMSQMTARIYGIVFEIGQKIVIASIKHRLVDTEQLKFDDIDEWVSSFTDNDSILLPSILIDVRIENCSWYWRQADVYIFLAHVITVVI